MVTETICENSEIILEQDSLVGTKQGELPNRFKDSSSTSKQSDVKFTNGLKQSRSNGSIFINRKKKIEIFKDRYLQYKIKRRIKKVHKKKINKDTFFQDNSIKIYRSKKSFPVKNLVAVKNTSEVKKDLIIQHHDKISKSREYNSDANSRVFNNTHENTFEVASYLNNLIDIVCYFCSNDRKNNYSNNANNYNEIGQNGKSNLSNSTSVSQITIENKNKASYDSLLSMTNEDMNVNKSIGTHNVTKSPNSIYMRSNDFENRNNGIKPKISTFTDNDIANSENTNSKYTSDSSNSPNKHSVTDVQKLVKKITKKSCLELKTILSTKDLSFIELEELCSQMIFKQMKNMFDKDKQHKKFMEFKDHDKDLKNYYKALLKEQSSIGSVLEMNEIELKKELSQKLKNTRSVGIQTEESYIHSLSEVQKVSVHQKDNNDNNNNNNKNKNNYYNDDDTGLESFNSKNDGLSLSTNIEKKNDLPAPNIIQNSSVIQIDEDDEILSKTVNSDSSDLSKCAKINKKKVGVLRNPNMLQNPLVIQIDDDDEPLSKTVNSDSSYLSKCTKITQKKVGVLRDPNMLQNPLVIQIDDDDDDEPLSKTVNSDSSYLSKCTKITQKKVGVLPDPKMLQNPPVIQIFDDELISKTEKERKKQPSRLVTQENVDTISDDDEVIDLDKKLSNKQLCIKDSKKKDDEINLLKEVIGPHVDITSDDVLSINVKEKVNQSCSKAIEEKSANESSSSNPLKLFQLLTQKKVPSAILIEKGYRKMNAAGVTKNDKTSKHNLENSIFS